MSPAGLPPACPDPAGAGPGGPAVPGAPPRQVGGRQAGRQPARGSDCPYKTSFPLAGGKWRGKGGVFSHLTSPPPPTLLVAI